MERIKLTNGSTITLKRGDITVQSVDVVVNAANAYLAAGGGVSGAIHRAAGPGLKDECDDIALKRGMLKPGQALVTGGHDLDAKWIVHALGPQWQGGSAGEPATLAATYRAAIELADQQRARSVAFPSISTGIFGYPVAQAASVAIDAVSQALEHAGNVREIVFVLFDADTHAAYSRVLQQRA